MHNLVIDIGNTNYKLAIFKDRELISFYRTKQIDRNSVLNIIKQYNIKNATLSTVNKGEAELIDLLRETVNYVPFTAEITGKIKNKYQSTSTLGLDRWAKLIAAHTLHTGTNCLMIDAGTCITYDVLTADGEYFGGSISLGIKMRFEALHHFTQKLPLVNWVNDENDIPYGTNTTNAIKNGVLQGVVNEVLGFITIENNKNKNLKIIITGGDADFLCKQLKNSIFAGQITLDPYLVLKGLNEAITL